MTQSDTRAFPLSFIASTFIPQTFGIVAVLSFNFTMLRHHKVRPPKITMDKLTRSEPFSVSHGRAFFQGRQQRSLATRNEI